MKDSLKANALINHFRDWSEFTVADIKAFYQQLSEDIKRSTLDWRIYELKKQGVLQKVGRGIYSLEPKTPFLPIVDQKLKDLYNKLNKQFPILSICGWNTKWLNEFMTHQPMHFYTLIEVEKDGMESVFYFIREQTKKPVYLDPGDSFLEKYGVQSKEPVIVKQLITEAPTHKVNKVTVPTLEKVLVDLFCDKAIFEAQQGAEFENILINAFERYRIDEPKMLRYAARRKKRNSIENYLKKFKEKGGVSKPKNKGVFRF